ncbi:MAG: hypothetical protein ACRDUS_22050 [Mycobacterium sp.]
MPDYRQWYGIWSMVKRLRRLRNKPVGQPVPAIVCADDSQQSGATVAMLTWIKDGNWAVIPFHTSVYKGSGVRVRGRHYAANESPEFFQVFRGYGSFSRRFLKLRNMPTEKLVVSDLAVVLAQPGLAVSEEFLIPTPGYRLRAPVFVRDSLGTDTHPNPIFATRLGGIDIEPKIGYHGIDVSVIKGEISTAVDPELRFEVLLPWANGDGGTVRDVLGDIANDLVDWNDGLSYDDVYSSLLKDAQWALPGEPLEGWSVGVSETGLSLAEGQAAPLGVLFRTPTTGAVAFAVQAAGLVQDPHTGEETYERIVSDIFVLDVDRELGQVTLCQL